LSKGFATTRHPRTVVGRERDGAIWLITVDGRQPGRAVGMTFVELQDLLGRLDVTDALNLDGGGSTTMVAGGQVVNRPSDLTGPRAVSDALIVTPR
jgi:exopolysaccharide biosynthesis protein